MRVILCSLLLVISGCQKKSEGPPPRYAIARFENLTGDPALDWVARAANEYLSRTLTHALDGPVLTTAALIRAGAGSVSNDRAKATLAGATHLVSGYLEQVGGKLRLYAIDEDLSSRNDVRHISAQAAQPLPALSQLAHEFSASATPYLTANPEALKLYAGVLDEPASRALPDLRAATQADPNFGPAWIALIDATLLSGDRSATRATIAESLTHNLDPIDKATARIQQAAMENDKSARLAAMRDLSSLTPADLLLLKSVAEYEISLGQFTQAAGEWRKLGQADPNNRDAWNQLGYTLAWSGDLSGALDALKTYAARWPDDPNALDSTGDIYYLYGKFADAAAWYLKANQKGPQLLNSGDLYKAAWAQFKAGDTKKADATFEQFRAARSKSNPIGFAEFEGDWLYCTGREKEAFAVLRKAADSATPQAASALLAQLVILDLLSGDRVTAANDAAIGATRPPSLLSSIARFAALPSASAAEWQTRAGQDPSHRLPLAIALLLDGKKEAARALWEQIAADSPTTDFFSRAIAARLKGEKPKFQPLPDPMSVNPLRAISEKPVV